MLYFNVIVHMIFTCTATRILYVLPDNVSDVNCPSQPCATLGQYLLDNGSLPVSSDVEYYFLPGQHHITKVVDIWKAVDILLVGVGLSPVELVCWSHSNVNILYSYNITIRNFLFNQCNGNVVYKANIDIGAGLFIFECFICVVENVSFLGHGFVGVNLFFNSSLNNISININMAWPVLNLCSAKLLVMFIHTDFNHDHDSITLNKVSVSGYSDICYNKPAMKIWLIQSIYSMTVELHDSYFYDMDRMALGIAMKNADNSLLISNCTFNYVGDGERRIH